MVGGEQRSHFRRDVLGLGRGGEELLALVSRRRQRLLEEATDALPALGVARVCALGWRRSLTPALDAATRAPASSRA